VEALQHNSPERTVLLDPRNLIRVGDLSGRRDAVLPIVFAILVGLGISALVTWLDLPSWSSQVAVISGVLLGLFSLRYLYRLELTLLSKKHVDNVNRWMLSGDLVTMLEGLSQRETLRLADMTRNRFGKVVLKTGVSPKGKKWSHKEPRVGFKILPTNYRGKLAFNVILYRRDLASQKRIPRPWRTIPLNDGNLQLIKPGRLIKLPNWIAGQSDLTAPPHLA